MTTEVGAQALLGESGATPEVEWNGVTWKIGHPVQRAKAVLEELAAAKAVRSVVALKSALAPAEYAEAYSEVLRQVTAGDFRTWGVGWVRQVAGADGSALFLLSLLRCHHPQATEADAAGLLAACPGEVNAAVERVTPRFFDLLVSAVPGLTPEARADLTALFRARLTPSP